MSQYSTDLSKSTVSSIKYVAGTDIGRAREENQDSYGIIKGKNFFCFVVADGMGGVKGGAIASKTAIEVFSSTLEKEDEITEELLKDGIQLANTAVYKQGLKHSELSGMGTTFCGFAVTEKGLYTFNVGDSRVYKINGGTIEQLTTDHTLIGELVRAGSLTEKQAENHPVAHMLTRSLGPVSIVEPDIIFYDTLPQEGDSYLVCSDGLYNLVKDEEIAEIVSSHPLDCAKKQLIDLANERGGTDNITVIICSVADKGAKEEEIEKEEIHLSLSTQKEKEAYSLKEEREKIGKEEREQAKEESSKEIRERKSYETPSIEDNINLADFRTNLFSSSTKKDQKKERDDSKKEKELEKSSEIVKEKRSPFFHFVIGGLVSGILVVAVGGLYVYKNFYLPSQKKLLKSRTARSPKIPALLPQIKQPKIAKESYLLKEVKSNSGSYSLPRVEAIFLGSAKELTADLKQPSQEEKITKTQSPEKERIAKQKALIKKKIKSLEQKIKLISAPISSEILTILKTAQQTSAKLKKELTEVRAKLDQATRKLAIWYERKKLLKKVSPVNISNQIAVSSPEVKEAKEAFERATWEYLKASEELRFNPANLELRKRTNELARIRREKMEALSKAIKNTIQKEVSTADHEITELTLKRDELEHSLTQAEEDIEFANIVLKGDKKAKENKKKEMEQELLLLRSELKELQLVLQ